MDSKQQELTALVEVPLDRRDLAWRERLKDVVSRAVLFGTPRGGFHGPDGFPYLAMTAQITAVGFLPFHAVARNAVEHVHGVALFRSADGAGEPAYILSHGDLLGFDSYGDIDVTLAHVAREGVFEKGELGTRLRDGRLIGAPSAKFVPKTTRDAVRRVMEGGYKLADPRLFAYFDPQLGVHVALNLSEARGLKQTPENLRAVLSQLAWFFPRSYQLCVLPSDIDLANVSR